MTTPTIPNGEEYFFPIIYEGNGAGQRVGKFVPFTDNGTIDNSLIFNDGDSPSLARTPSSGGDRRTWTFSAWIKRGNLTGAVQYIFSASDSASSTKYDYIYFDTDNTIDIQHYNGSGTEGRIKTNRTFEDTSKFYHLFYVFDSTNATAGNRMRLYIDGDEITSFSIDTNPSLNYETDVNDTTPQTLGKPGWASAVFFDGYMAEVNLVDGTALTPSTFGVTDTSTGRWIPKTLSGITYGTNGFRLKFQDSSSLGDDTSGNGNDLTATNLASTDQTTDSPTQNHATLSPHSLYKSSNFTLSEGNLKATSTSTAGTHSGQGGMRIPNGGKYYWECEIDSGKNGMGIGIIPADTPTTSANPSTATLYLSSGSMRTDGSNAISYGSGVSDGDIMGFALDLSNPANGKLYVSVNGTYENSGNPVTGANPAPANPLIGDFRVIYQDGSNGYAPVYIYNFGQKSFNTAPPTGFSALQQDNLPETAKGIVGLTWIKDRDNAYSHGLRDSSRGRHKDIFSNLIQAEVTNPDGVQRFLKGGIEIEDLLGLNASGASIVAWNWVANGGSTSSNTDGSITSTVQANTTAGFSIVQYTGTGSAGTIGHGLSSAPEWIVVKSLGTGSWYNYHSSVGATKYALLNTTAGFASSALVWNNTEPTSSVFSLGSGDSNTNSANFIAYCWHGVEGFSKFGSYIGNLSSDGPFIYTGFTPTWLLIKNSADASQWRLFDGKRNTFNPVNKSFRANDTTVEFTDNTFYLVDFLSNGFKIRGAGSTDMNSTAGNYVYMAFAEHPFVGDGTSPVTAR